MRYKVINGNATTDEDITSDFSADLVTTENVLIMHEVATEKLTRDLVNEYQNTIEVILEEIAKTQKRIKRILWKSPYEELVELLFGAKEELLCLMNNLVLRNQTGFEDINILVNNTEVDIIEMMNEVIDDTELAMSDVNVTKINRMFLDTADVVEQLKNVRSNITETFSLAKEKLVESQNDEDQIMSQIEALNIAVVSSFCKAIDSIIKVHPIWASMTLALMFSPGLVFGLNAFMIRMDDSRMVGNLQLGKCGNIFIYFVLFPALTFCFPFGVLFSQVCEIFVVPFGDTAMIAAIEYVTNMAIGFEAFLESAPQIILQMYIVFSSGIVSNTQIVSIIFSMVMLAKTTIMYDLMGTKRSSSFITVVYLLAHLPMYLCSGYFRLGTITLSSIFFGYWAILPILLLSLPPSIPGNAFFLGRFCSPCSKQSLCGEFVLYRLIIVIKVLCFRCVLDHIRMIQILQLYLGRISSSKVHSSLSEYTQLFSPSFFLC